MGTIGFDEFGRRFVEQVVTADRVEATFAGVVAGSFETGARLAAGLVRVHGSGTVERVRVDRVLTDALAYRATMSISLELSLRISGMPYQYRGRGSVALDLYAVARDDLSIFIEVPDVDLDDVSLELRPQGTVAALLDQLGGVQEQVRLQIVRFVNERKDDPDAVAKRTIDITQTIESEWERRRRENSSS